MGMHCIAIIPARHHSERFPGKSLASLAGRPLIHHVVDRCIAVASIEQVVVATDDERIAAAAEAAGADTVMTPPDLPSGTDRVALVAEHFTADVILNVQGDEPLIDPVELDRVVGEFWGSGADFGTLRSPLTEVADLWNPNVVKLVVDRRERALYFSRAPIPFPRAQWDPEGSTAGPGAGEDRRGPEDAAVIAFDGAPSLPGPYWLHVGVYLFRRPALARWAKLSPSQLERREGLEQMRILEAGEELHTYAVAEAAPGVDTPDDLERLRSLLESRPELDMLKEEAP